MALTELASEETDCKVMPAEAAISLSSPPHLQHLTSQNSALSFFSRLPAEIRYDIYDYVLRGYQVSLMTKRNGNLQPREHSYPDFVNIPQVCRQIYAECAPLVYSQNTIYLDKVDRIEQFTKKRTNRQLSNITEIGLRPQHIKRLTSSGGRVKNVFPNLKAVIMVTPRVYWQADLQQFYDLGKELEGEGVDFWVGDSCFIGHWIWGVSANRPHICGNWNEWKWEWSDDGKRAKLLPRES